MNNFRCTCRSSSKMLLLVFNLRGKFMCAAITLRAISKKWMHTFGSSLIVDFSICGECLSILWFNEEMEIIQIGLIIFDVAFSGIHGNNLKNFLVSLPALFQLLSIYIYSLMVSSYLYVGDWWRFIWQHRHKCIRPLPWARVRDMAEHKQYQHKLHGDCDQESLYQVRNVVLSHPRGWLLISDDTLTYALAHIKCRCCSFLSSWKIFFFSGKIISRVLWVSVWMSNWYGKTFSLSFVVMCSHFPLLNGFLKSLLGLRCLWEKFNKHEWVGAWLLNAI